MQCAYTKREREPGVGGGGGGGGDMYHQRRVFSLLKKMARATFGIWAGGWGGVGGMMELSRV